eukprot:6183730-Pleurochrysis_carterae.AAC.1
MHICAEGLSGAGSSNIQCLCRRCRRVRVKPALRETGAAAAAAAAACTVTVQSTVPRAPCAASARSWTFHAALPCYVR